MQMIAVATAAFFQLNGISFFICQPEDQCSPAPVLASWLFLLASLCFLSDIEVFPRRFAHMGKYWQLAVEIFACVLLAEICTLIIWCSFERIVFILTRELIFALGLGNCCNWCIEYWLQGVTTTAVSFALLQFTMNATDTIYLIRHYTRKTSTNLWQLWSAVNAVSGMNKAEIRRTLKLAKSRQKRRGRKQADECDETDEDVGDEENFG
ncbi:hypothetical protein KR222_004580 [Zaprionus bogoriensis]|nr:hypothetical protein KR222_004580 [Zaprionus bogoriensis]